MSHPYALTRDGEGGAVIAGHAYPASDTILVPFGLPVGRMVRIDAKGSVLWDVRFKPENSPDDHNVECYGGESGKKSKAAQAKTAFQEERII
jgi:hypothetical protein